MGTILDGLEDHEGYAEHPAGDLGAFAVYVAACGCVPLLARSIPPEVRRMIDDLTAAVGHLIQERPLAGLEALRTLATWAEVSAARLQLAVTPPRRTPGRGPSLGL